MGSLLRILKMEQERLIALGYRDSHRSQKRRARRARMQGAGISSMVFDEATTITRESLLATLDSLPKGYVPTLPLAHVSPSQAEAMKREGLDRWFGGEPVVGPGEVIEERVVWWQDAIRRLRQESRR